MQAARGTTIGIDEAATTPVPVWSRGRAMSVIGAVMAAGVLVDQLTKVWAERSLPAGEAVPFIGTLLQFRLVWNSGAAFSLGAGSTWLFSLLAIAALCALLFWFAPRIRRPAWAVAAGLFGAGIAGNLIDRLFRAPGPLRGHVVDFLQLPYWAIFNVADMCISFAAVLLVWLSVFGRFDHAGRSTRDKAKPEPEDAEEAA